MRVFLDTNVLVSAFATRGLCEDVMREVLLRHRLVLSEVLLKELKAVLRAKIGLPKELIMEIVEFLDRDSDRVESSEPIKIRLRDREDVILLSDAVRGGAELFVTGDKEVLALGMVGQMAVVSPRMFWERMRTQRH